MESSLLQRALAFSYLCFDAFVFVPESANFEDANHENSSGLLYACLPCGNTIPLPKGEFLDGDYATGEMAWDSKSSPWDWDNAMLFQGQAADNFRKRASPNVWSNESELEVTGGTAVSQTESLCSSGFGPSVSPFGFGSSSLPGASANDVSGQSHTGRLGQRRSAEERHNGASFSNGCPDKCEGDSNSTLLEHRELGPNAGKDKNVGFLQLRRQLPSRGFEEDLSGSPDRKAGLTQVPSEQQRKAFPSDGKGAEQDPKEGEGSHLTEEHHVTKAGAWGSGDSLICLKLGKRTYFEDTTTVGGSRAAASASVVPVKKPRSAASGVQTPRCQVEGCKTDLTSAKDYHRRHKVCEMHSKAERVMVAGQEQRFCQQCSRFHVLSEFDEGKRSCRRRLAGHNERRRKPQPDPLALSRITLPFQDDRRFGHLVTDRQSFFHYPRITGISSSWEDSDELKCMHGKGVWPRMVKLEDQSVYDCPIQGPGMERQLFLSGLSQQTNDRLPLLLIQSPKDMLPMSNDVASQRVLPYLQNSMGPIGQNLTLSSASGAGVFSGLEPAPASQNLTRVSDSGRALSLLSPQTWCSHAPAPVSLDLSTRSNMTLDQWIHETPLAQQMVQGEQQQQFDLTAEKLFSIASHSQNVSVSNGLPAELVNSLEKEHHVRSFMHGLNGAGNFEAPSMFSVLQGHGLRGSQGNICQDVRPTIDLMRVSSSSQNSHLKESSGAFQLGGSHFGELQALRSYESPIFDSQQML